MAGYGLFGAGQQNAKVLLTGRYAHNFEGVIFSISYAAKVFKPP
jgi:hypothetical protein